MEMLQVKWDEDKFVCVGLDSEQGRVNNIVGLSSIGRPQDRWPLFNRLIVDATHEFVCAYKPNAAFYEAKGPMGLEVLHDTISYIHAVAPDVLVILDAKRGDIDNTNNGYVESIFDFLGADAVTVSPYLGSEAMKPFLERYDKGIIVLCRTSNKGAGELQDLVDLDGVPFYQRVASVVADDWNYNGNCALVVGVRPDHYHELAEVRQTVGDMPFLIPGIGAQGGEVEATVKAGQDSKGQGMIINSSRGIIFASNGEDFAEAARAKTLELHEKINRFRIPA